MGLETNVLESKRGNFHFFLWLVCVCVAILFESIKANFVQSQSMKISLTFMLREGYNCHRNYCFYLFCEKLFALTT